MQCVEFVGKPSNQAPTMLSDEVKLQNLVPVLKTELSTLSPENMKKTRETIKMMKEILSNIEEKVEAKRQEYLKVLNEA